MKIAIRYYSKTGNMKKMAEALSEELGIKAETVDVPVSEDVDVLFLGSAVYAAGVDKHFKDFIAKMNPGIKNVVNFSSAAILPSSYSQIKSLLKARNIPLDEKEFHCRGRFLTVHRGRPNAEDLNELRVFGRNIFSTHQTKFLK